jgi:hypothetical protein
LMLGVKENEDPSCGNGKLRGYPVLIAFNT